MDEGDGIGGSLITPAHLDSLQSIALVLRASRFNYIDFLMLKNGVEVVKKVELDELAKQVEEAELRARLIEARVRTNEAQLKNMELAKQMKSAKDNS